MPENIRLYLKPYLNYLTFEKRYSHHTVISYENDLNSFFEFAEEMFSVKAPVQVSTVMVRSWMASLKEKKFASKSINRKLSCIKSFYKYLLRMQLVNQNPATTIPSLKVSSRLPVYLEESQMPDLFCKNFFEDNYVGKLEYIILQIFYQTGIRLSELINLKQIHVDKHSTVIKVLGKGNKERLIPINNSLLHEIEYFIQERDKEFSSMSEYLVVNIHGEKLNPRYVYSLVKKHLGRVSTISRKSPHILRHTFATHLTNKGAEINAIKDLLGHSSLAATQVYTHNSIEKLKEVYNQAHPRA